MTRVALFASIVLGAVSLALGYAVAGKIVPSLIILIFGAIWFYVQWRDGQGFSTVGLALAVVVAVAGSLWGVGIGWMFAGVTFSLFAWDLIEFRKRLQFASVESDIPTMEKRHFIRLGILAIVGMVLLFPSVSIRLRLGLWWLILLAFILATGLAWLTWRLRQS